MNKNQIQISDYLSFNDKSDVKEKRGLRGHVQIYRKNLKTGEVSLWDESSNVIPLSGYQWILMKMFGLYLDSSHAKSYEDIGRDTTVVVPDLNDAGKYQMGVAPEDYAHMESNISENHFVQGFMIGNGGSGEDTISSKNTNYSFMKLRNPIPFQQTQTSLPSEIKGQYLGKLRVGESSFSKSYYIKKFDERPHIYHSWWSDGQRWDHLDPVTQNDLGPDAVNGAGKTNRIETYCECKLSLSEDDCISYFKHDGSTQTALVNELGLVAYDTIPGTRSIIEKLYDEHIKRLLQLVFDNNRGDVTAEVQELATDIQTVLNETLADTNNSRMKKFMGVIDTLTTSDFDYEDIQAQLTAESNIMAEGYYNRNGVLVYTTDEFLNIITSKDFDSLTTDEAQRIKLVTYYTFKSIPLQSNWMLLFNYRIYAN